jgi:hypothetical protein
MSKRYSERLTETFRDDELSKLNGTGINGRNGVRSKMPRQSSGKESLPMYRPTRGTANPFRCNSCGSPQLKAFATMYAQGTSTAVSMKGFFFKHSYQKTWRQTEMAKLCAPPHKKALFPALFLLVIAAGGTFAVCVDCLPTAVSGRVMVFCFLLGWFGLYLSAYHVYWNLRYFPQRMTEYHRLHFCCRCGTVTRV